MQHISNKLPTVTLRCLHYQHDEELTHYELRLALHKFFEFLQQAMMLLISESDISIAL